MLCKEECPRVEMTKGFCEPLSNYVTDDGSDYVCVGHHKEKKEEKYKGDKFRHCFRTETTDTMYDYDEYDMKSVIAVMSEALVVDELGGYKQ